jgi:hypothetical protein
MLIKLKCLNENCEYCFEVSEAELRDNPQYYERCLVCGSKLKVEKECLKEIVKKDLYQQAEEYLNKWFGEMGIEGTLEMIEKFKEQPTYRIYQDLLRKRGLIK